MKDGLTYDKLLQVAELAENSKVELNDFLSCEEIQQLEKQNRLKTQVEQNIEDIVKRGVLKAYKKYMRVTI